ncbi:response regulator [Sphingomonas sp.]|uniref:hybrid sensor histidine kinase/response regulator n=1 Tax=Sphingomonas sp. TaxID=28214 RepID=UPI0025FFFBEF|nr:response regulator [Sphingomonas sp.]MBV9528468.1 response regulator [Sphingomonas sp.]
MIHGQLSPIGSRSLVGWARWLPSAIAAAVGATVAILLLLVGRPVLALVGLVIGLGAAAVLRLHSERVAAPLQSVVSGPDFALVGAALELSVQAAALTSSEGSLLIANTAYRERFGANSPLAIAADDSSTAALANARSLAWRDGAGCVAGVETATGKVQVEVERGGNGGELLLWRFPLAAPQDPVRERANWLAGGAGERLAAAGVLAAVVDSSGRVVAANGPFAGQAAVDFGDTNRPLFADLLNVSGNGFGRLKAQGEAGAIYRIIEIPFDAGGNGAGTVLLVEEANGGAPVDSGHLQALLDVLPVGLALVDRDGRFLTMNHAFRQAAGMKGGSAPTYPGDLVVKEDKAAVADTVRRNARGPAMSGDLAVRLVGRPSEPVALTIAGLRGLGDAAVLLLLKDNSEEAKLKRQVAQATKMQMVGQLAGGVAHDFNNILTAIIGHCDLMLMRHTPGDSDYDDIQQIKSNSNRAAGLTRQLLAFSRQQTLRPQVLQLPDVVSEVSHLLKRLLGETLELVVKHGRNLGPVRADPGQLEQVIVNLAVNARDAMADKGGGTLTIQTFSVKADQVAELGSDILPIADYSALSVTDTGTGIAPSVLGKIFEPFFTTKEVGKGTGLGLSTVYGIVKQSGGFIFADSKIGEGTRFVIYLPVHREESTAGKPRKSAKEKADELWGSGTVLLVEDEPMVRAVAERALTRHGYQVITADNGEEALEVLARNEPIDLLISDVVMPGMDGPTMVGHARKTRPTLKILFMSGYAEEQLRNSLDVDNVSFLPKPFSVQELAEAAKRTMAAK